MPLVALNSPNSSDLKPGCWEKHLLGSVGNAHIRHRRVCAKSANLHRHLDADESFYVLQGEMILEIEGKSHTLRPGDFAVVRAGEEHRTIVSGTAELLVIDTIE